MPKDIEQQIVPALSILPQEAGLKFHLMNEVIKYPNIIPDINSAMSFNIFIFQFILVLVRLLIGGGVNLRLKP